MKKSGRNNRVDELSKDKTLKFEETLTVLVNNCGGRDDRGERLGGWVEFERRSLGIQFGCIQIAQTKGQLEKSKQGREGEKEGYIWPRVGQR